MSYQLSDLENAFQAKDITTPKMRDAILEWEKAYYAEKQDDEYDPCQRIPYTVVTKITKTAFAEYSVTGNDDFEKSILNALNEKRQTAMHKALIGGVCGIKPIPQRDTFGFSLVIRSNMLVFGRDQNGTYTDIGTWEQSVKGRYYYTLLERRSVDNKGFLTIRNMLFRSEVDGDLGIRVQLKELQQYEQLKDEYTYKKPIGGVGIAWLRTTIENCVDGSPDPVSIYAAGMQLNDRICRNEAQLNGEFDRGKSRIIASADMLEYDPKTKKRRLAADVFTAVDEAPEDVGITIFSPAFREASFLARKREYLRNMESIIGLKRGLLADVDAEQRTATEVHSSEADYELTIIDFQQMWEKALREAMRLCSIFGEMYKITGSHKIKVDSVIVDFGNGVLYDEDRTWADYKEMVAAGLVKPEIAVAWRFNMPWETEEDLLAVRKKYMPIVDGMKEGLGE